MLSSNKSDKGKEKDDGIGFLHANQDWASISFSSSSLNVSYSANNYYNTDHLDMELEEGSKEFEFNKKIKREKDSIITFKKQKRERLELSFKDTEEIIELIEEEIAKNGYKDAFKKALENNNFIQQAVVLQSLGDKYLGKKEYTKAAALYNTALVITKDKLVGMKFNHLQDAIVNSIIEVEILFVGKVLNKQIPANLIMQELTLRHKEFLDELRKKVRNVLESIEAEYNYGKEQNRNIRILYLRRAERIRSLNKDITNNVKIFLNILIKECQETIGSPPEGCKYTIIGLGSLAMGTITPYSDIEFTILINEDKEEYKEYFRNLTRLLNIKVINLGETGHCCVNR
ncbi:hypothetical protein H1Q59_07515 [Holosporaceae bacterium 'Namur']|nr:hypothetical protein [Holosporaceae bacterium 'Namur']